MEEQFDIRTNIIVDKLKTLLANIIKKNTKKLNCDYSRILFIWNEIDNTVKLYLVGYMAGDKIVEETLVEKLSSVMNPLEVIGYKMGGFNVDVDTMIYVNNFYNNYCKINNIKKGDCEFAVTLILEKIHLHLVQNGTSKAIIPVSEIIKIGKND